MRKIVALGGGHGLAASLSALRRLTDDLTAVVTVADDGTSSGRLRQELGVLPPGDLREALVALCGDGQEEQIWTRVVQHRFSGAGPLGGHAVGNLLIVALWELLGETVPALEWMGRLLGARGRVLPMAAVPLDIEARVRGADSRRPREVSTIRSQAAITTTRGTVLDIQLLPEHPPATPEVLAAVREADWVVLGPGSWFTSVLPHLLVPELAAALIQTSASKVVALNLAPQFGETAGFFPETHLEVLAAYAPAFRVDVVLADIQVIGDSSRLKQAAADLGAELVVRSVARTDGTPRHDPQRLAAAYNEIFRRSGGRIGLCR